MKEELNAILEEILPGAREYVINAKGIKDAEDIEIYARALAAVEAIKIYGRRHK